MRKFGAILLVLVVLTGFFQLMFFPQRNTLGASTSTPRLGDPYRALIDLEQNTQVDISTTPPDHSKSLVYETLSEADENSLSLYVPLLQYELQKYSVEELKESGLKGIYLVKNLKIQTFSTDTYAVAGATDYARSIIFIDISTNQFSADGVVDYTETRGCDATEFARGIVHHELWHVKEKNNPQLIDDDDSKEYPSTNNLSVASERCLKPNAAFVSKYAQTTPSEDRAEQFRAKMTFTELRN